uniref:Uncharacterized protein n=1 Tax=Anopheles dirus TaxID=7168 RepID=A0A182NPQ9_9DIPT
MSSEDLVRPGLTTPFSGNLPAIKCRLRKKVPKLTANDVRRARVLFYEAITSELYESGHENAALFVLHLIEYEDAYVAHTSNPSIEAQRLRQNVQLLNYLCDTLTEAECFRQERAFEREVTVLLAVARKLTPDREKRWLAHQFFLVALDRCADCGLADARVKIESLVRFYYVQLLCVDSGWLPALKMLELANAALEAAALEGADVDQWKTLDETPESLAVAINTWRFKANRELALEMFGQPRWMREQYIRDAYKTALKTESCLSYGEFLCIGRRYTEALEIYKEALQRAELDEDRPDLVCSAILGQAEVYDKVGQPVRRDALLQRVDLLTRSRAQSLCRANYHCQSIAAELQNELPTDGDRLKQMLEQLASAMRLRARAEFLRCLELMSAAVSTSDEALYRLGDMFDQ